MEITPTTTPQAESQDDLARAYAQQTGAPASPAANPSAQSESQEDLAKEYAAQPTPEQGSDAAASALGAGGVPVNPLTVGVAKGTLETAHTLGAAAGHLMPDSWRDKLGLPSSFTEPNYLKSTNGAETAGKVAENLAEFVLGDGALKGLAISEKLGIAQKLTSMAKSSPYIARILEFGMNAGRVGTVGTAQPLAHGATGTEALESGAVAAATSGLIESGSALKNVISPVTRDIAGVSVPVRAAVVNPNLANKIAEFAANKPALQDFDVKQTQAAARDVIHNIAGETLKSSAEPLTKSLLQNLYEKLNVQFPEDATPVQRDAAIAQATDALNLVKNVTEKVQKADPKDFGETANLLKTKILGPMYDAANKSGEYNKWAQEEDAAFRRGDVEAENAAHASKQAAFIKANGEGVDAPTNKLYTRIDDLDRVHKVLATTLRPTPEAFLDDVTNGGKNLDPQIIDGLSLRKAVNKLSTDGTFEKAGIKPETASKLQELGALLERSKVQEGAKRGIYSTTRAGGTGAGVALGLDMILAHAATGTAATSAGVLALPVAAGVVGAYSMNRLLGYLLTNPAALDYTLRAARALVPPLASQAVTHVYDEKNGLTPAR